MAILFDRVSVVTMDRDRPVLQDAYVLVEGEKIVSVGTEAPKEFSGERIDGRGKVLMPGLVNLHTHVPMTAFRGYADGYDLQTWLNDYIFPAEDKLTARAITACTDLALAEMIASGITSFSDMYSFCDEIVRSTVAAGLKINVARGVVAFEEGYRFAESDAGRENAALVRDWHGYDNGRVKVDACIHAEYTSYPDAWRQVADYAKEQKLGMHVHLSETRREHEECKQKYGKTPAEVFDEAGVFDVPAIAAHCVWVEDGDIALLKARGVTPVHNPVSNMKLASGIAPVPKMLEAGLNVALGTDGVSSNNSHDMFEEIKLCAIAHKAVTLDPMCISTFDALEMATGAGAKGQQREGECGRVAEGYDADLILVDFDRPHLTPTHDILSNLVFSARASDVCMNMVRGRIVYKDGVFHTIDVERAKRETRDYVVPLFA